jgi:hypothetical protein
VDTFYGRTPKGPPEEDVKLPPGEDANEAIRHARQTRLRQAISHPFGLETWLRESIRMDDLQSLRADLDANGGKIPVSEQLKLGKSPDSLLSYQYGLDKLKRLSRDSPAFGGTFNMQLLLGFVINERKVAKYLCPKCGKTPQEPIKSKQVRIISHVLEYAMQN